MPEIRKIQFFRRNPKAFRKGRVLSIRNIVLHSTDGREAGDIATLTGPGDLAGHSKQIRHWSLMRMLNWPLRSPFSASSLLPP